MSEVAFLPARAAVRMARVRPEHYLHQQEIADVRRWLQQPGIEDTDLSYRVARVCLDSVQDQLPQWGCVRGGEITLARPIHPRRGVVVELAPQHLFTINWADSGPGYSWPEAYYATWLSGFRRWIVTASVDSTDTWGVTDLAIGVVGARGDLVRCCGRVIVQYWRQWHYCEEMEGWECLWDTGRVDAGLALEWRERVWGSRRRRSRSTGPGRGSGPG